MGLILFFIYFMLPHFLEMFSGFSVELPLPTRILIKVSYVLTNLWWLVLLGLGVLFVLFRRFKATDSGRRKLDQLKMNLPIVGKVIRVNLFAQFARTLSTLLQNGVPVLTALKITEQVMPNHLLKEAIAKTREAVTDGKTIAQPLAQSKLFPQLMVDLVKIGEDTGDVPGALANLADTYEGELQISLRIMMNLIEPLLIVVMAVGVGFLLLSVLLPMFKLISNISAEQ
jgi:type II secretory pathway component PulF